MDNVKRYAAINTKIRVLEGKLLSNEDYMNLLSKKSLPEVAAYLREKTRYSEVLEGALGTEVHRGSLEILIKQSHKKSLEKLVHYLQDEYREFYRSLFVRYEIEDLKTVLRGIKTGRNDISLMDSLTHIDLFSSLGTGSGGFMQQPKSLRDFINIMKGSIYYDYLYPYIKNEEEPTLFSIEMALDLMYFDIFYKSTKLLDSHDRKVVEDIQGINVDLMNLQWIYRGLKFYSLPPEVLFNYTINYGSEFNRKDIKNLCYSKSLDEFQKKTMSTRYSFLFDNENTKDIFMERRILRYQYFAALSMRKKRALDISQVIAYILLLEMEIRDLVSVIENIRYRTPVEEAEKFLIRKL